MAVLISVRAEQDQMGRVIKQDALFSVEKHFMISEDPKMFGMVLHSKDDLLDYIHKTGVFVVNYCEKDPVEMIEADNVFCKKVEDARHLECEVIDTISAGDSFIVVGKVLGQ